MGDESGPIRIAFDAEGVPDADGRAWYGPSGAACTVVLPAGTFDPNGSEAACRFRVEAWSDRPGAAVDVLVTNGGAVMQELALFGRVEHAVEIVLRAVPGAHHRLAFRAADGGAEPVAIHVRDAGSVVRRRDLRGRDAVIEAGLQASLALLPAAVGESVWSNAGALADILATAVRAGAPFSMIRLGDGEGRILGYPILLTEQETESATISYMFGPAAVERLRARHGESGASRGIVTLRRLVAQAVTNADCIGLPGAEHFRRYLALPDGPRKEGLANAMVGFAGALLGAARYLALPADRMFDTYIFHGMQEGGLLDRVLNGLDFVGLVAHTDRRREIGERFAIRTVEHLPIPPHQTFMPSDDVHFPDGFERIVDAIRPAFAGAPYLVAAGYLGKAYCDVVKARGGVALDIGSLFDGWFGQGNPVGIRNPRLRLLPA